MCSVTLTRRLWHILNIGMKYHWDPQVPKLQTLHPKTLVGERSVVEDRQNGTRHVLTGQIPPASTTPVSWTTIKSSPSPSNLTLKSYGPDTDFGYLCTVTLTLEFWPWVKAWPTLKSWTTIAWNIIQIQHGSEELWHGHGFRVCVHCNLDLGGMTLGQSHGTPFGHGQHLWEILSRSNMAVKSYGPDTDFGYVWPWPWRYDLGSRSWHTLGSWTTIVWNIIQIQHGSEELWPGHWIWVCVHCDLDLGGMTLGQGYDTPLGHGQQLCEILSRSNMAVRSYGLDMDSGYVCTVTLTLEVWPWVKVMTHPWVMDNNCVIYYPDPTWQLGVMAWTRILGMCALWPWPWRYDLGSRSWHILGSWTIIVWNIIQIGQGVKELWPGHDVNRRTDRQGDSYTVNVEIFAWG